MNTDPYRSPQSDVTVDPELAVKYKNNRLDLNWFSLRTAFASLRVQAFMLIICIAFFLIIRYSGDYQWLVKFVMASILYLFMWLVQALMTIVMTASKKNDSMLSEQLIEVNEDGITETNEFHRLTIFWKGVVRVVEANRFVAIYFTDLQAILIPDRAFSSNEHRSRFVSFVRGKILAA